MEWWPGATEARRLIDDKGLAEKLGDDRSWPRYLYDWDPSFDTMFDEGGPRPEADLLAQAERVKRAAQAPRRIRGWIIEGRRAIAQPGATLSGLAKAITGNPEDWRKLDFPRRPETLQAGEVIDITPLLAEAVERGRIVVPEPLEPEGPLKPEPVASKGVTPEMIARAQEKGWAIEGTRARALAGATLSGLAWAITGHGSDYSTIPYTGRPEDLREGQVIDMTPLLELTKERQGVFGDRPDAVAATQRQAAVDQSTSRPFVQGKR